MNIGHNTGEKPGEKCAQILKYILIENRTNKFNKNAWTLSVLHQCMLAIQLNISISFRISSCDVKYFRAPLYFAVKKKKIISKQCIIFSSFDYTRTYNFLFICVFVCWNLQSLLDKRHHVQSSNRSSGVWLENLLLSGMKIDTFSIILILSLIVPIRVLDTLTHKI